MHTLYVLAIGFALLILCLLIGRYAVGSGNAMRKAALIFVPLWLVGAGINMAIGILKHDIPAKEEFPIFLLVFAAPALTAVIFWWWSWQDSKK